MDTHRIKSGADVQQLVPVRGTLDVALTPERVVLCVHRGTEPIEDMFNSDPYLIRPGFFEVSYAAAVHFRNRSIVAGSRNPETGRQVSFISIIGIVEVQPLGGFRVIKAVDKPEEWEPFTEAERAEYENKDEALDRPNMVNPIDPTVTVQPVNRVAGGASRVSAGKSGGRGKRGPEAATNAGDAVAPEVMQPIPADESSVLREAQEGRSRGGTRA